MPYPHQEEDRTPLSTLSDPEISTGARSADTRSWPRSRTGIRFLMIDTLGSSLTLASEFLMRNGCHVEFCEDLELVHDAVRRRHTAGQPYQVLIIASHERADLVRVGRVHRLDPELIIGFCTRGLTRDEALSRYARSQGCTLLLDEPLELNRLEGFLRELHRVHGPASAQTSAAGPAKDDTVPFFGVRRNTTTPETRRMERLQAPVIRTPVPLDPFPPVVERAAKPAVPTIPAAVRVQTPDDAPALPVLHPHPGQSPELLAAARTAETRIFGTSRIRRSVVGEAAMTPVREEDVGQTARLMQRHKGVACSACSMPFLVERKSEPFMVFCIHCGAMCRIRPG